MAEQFELLQSGIVMEQSDRLFRLGTDSVLLAAFAADRLRGRVCDLCAGAGAVGLLLCARRPSLHVTGVELQEEACALARKNIRANALSERFAFLQGDVRRIRELLPHGSFDAVVCNPPYFPVRAGARAQADAIALARTEIACTLPQLCDAAAWLLREKGSLYLVHRPQRLPELMGELRARRLEPKELRLVRHNAHACARIALLRCVAGARPGLTCLPELLLTDENGAPSAEYRAIYHTEGV